MTFREFKKLKEGDNIYFKGNKYYIISDMSEPFGGDFEYDHGIPLCTKEQYESFEEYFIHIAACGSSITLLTPSDLWPSGYYCGDGSGKKYSRYPALTRCGVGVHYVNTYKIPMHNFPIPIQ